MPERKRITIEKPDHWCCPMCGHIYISCDRYWDHVRNSHNSEYQNSVNIFLLKSSARD